MEVLLEKYELIKLGFWFPFYTNSKYHEFMKISKFKILLYNKIL